MDTVTTSAAAPVAPAADTSGASANEVSDQQNNSAEPQASQAVTKAQKEKFKLKVDGEEFEEEIDLNDKEELRRRFQLSHAAQKRMAKAQEDSRKAHSIVKEFEENPEAFLARLGPKGREIAEKFLLSQIQDEMLSPQEKEYRDLKNYKESTEAQKKAAQEKIEREAAEKMENEYAQNFQTTIIDALTKSGLPKSPELVKRFAGVMKRNLEMGLELTSDQLVGEVKREVTGLLKSIVGEADGDQLVKMFGDDVAKKIRKFDLKALQDKQNQLFQRPQGTSQNQSVPTPEKGYMTTDEWREWTDRKIKNLK